MANRFKSLSLEPHRWCLEDLRSRYNKSWTHVAILAGFLLLYAIIWLFIGPDATWPGYIAMGIGVLITFFMGRGVGLEQADSVISAMRASLLHQWGNDESALPAPGERGKDGLV